MSDADRDAWAQAVAAASVRPPGPVVAEVEIADWSTDPAAAAELGAAIAGVVARIPPG